MVLNGTKNKQEKEKDLQFGRYFAPPPDNSLFFVLKDRRALFLPGEEPHNGSEMHTTAEQYSSRKKTHLFISTNQGKRWIAAHIHNPAEAFKENIHARGVRGVGSAREQA